jgi:hypothetical protein
MRIYCLVITALRSCDTSSLSPVCLFLFPGEIYYYYYYYFIIIIDKNTLFEFLFLKPVSVLLSQQLQCAWVCGSCLGAAVRQNAAATAAPCAEHASRAVCGGVSRLPPVRGSLSFLLFVWCEHHKQHSTTRTTL